MFIKDGSELIGMLCINFDAAKYSRMAQELLALCGAHQELSLIHILGSSSLVQ